MNQENNTRTSLGSMCSAKKEKAKPESWRGLMISYLITSPAAGREEYPIDG